MTTIHFVEKGPNGKDIFGDYSFKNPNGKLIIFCHGFKGFKDWGHFNLIKKHLIELGYRFLKFNFSFNGVTQETPEFFSDLQAFGQNDYLKEVNDLEFIIDKIEKNNFTDKLLYNHFKDYPASEGYLIGHSRGGGIVTIVASRKKWVNKVIAWAGVSDFIKRLPEQEMLEKWENDGVMIIMNSRTNQYMPMHYDFVEILYKNKNLLNISNAIQKLGHRVAWIQGTNDESVSYKENWDVKQNNPLLHWVKVEGANHTFGGFHPYNMDILPKDTIFAIEESIKFIEL
jgi:pimeloyl-ACP methyl ester carboxylesterase